MEFRHQKISSNFAYAVRNDTAKSCLLDFNAAAIKFILK